MRIVCAGKAVAYSTAFPGYHFFPSRGTLGTMLPHTLGIYVDRNTDNKQVEPGSRIIKP